MTAVDRRRPEDPAVAAADLAEVFGLAVGRPPETVVAAPGRVNLIGEHTDYNGGLCLPVALPYAAYVAAARRSDQRLTAVSRQQPDSFEGELDGLGPGLIAGWPAYVAGVVWALRAEGFRLPGIDLVIDSVVPAGAGLSSSAALECAVALACLDVAGVAVGPAQRDALVRACVRAETEVAGAPTGGLDQTVSLFARPAHALLLDFDDGSRRDVRWAPEEAGLELLVIDTRAQHALTDGGYGSRRAECERAAAQLQVTRLAQVRDPGPALDRIDDDLLRRRTRHVLTEVARVRQACTALEAGRWSELGELFTASHTSLRDDFEVSCPELDTAVSVAVGHGALGARMTGGGFGGSAIALVSTEGVPAVEQAVAAAFAASDWPPPQFLSGLASAGARRIQARLEEVGS